MRAGNLKKLINIEYPNATSDGMGGSGTVWASLSINIWAAIWPISAKEMFQSYQITNTVSHKIRIRYRSDITPSMRVKYRTKYFNIVSIINPEMGNELLDLICKEVI